jgi:ketosteroid isomerase-like protein
MICLLVSPLVWTANTRAQEAQPAPPPQPAQGEPALPPQDQAAHEELRALRKDLVDAVIKYDFDRQMQYAHDDIVTTWQDGRVARGRDGLRKFLDTIDTSEGKMFQGYKRPPEPTAVSILHGGDTAISYGTSIASFKVAGKEFDLTNHWSATLVKEDGRWLLANYHVSGNILDNAVLNAAKNNLMLVGGIGIVVGLILGLVIGKVTGRKRKAA